MAKVDYTNDFHDHLDTCEQCRNQPHNLCVLGDRLLRAAVAQNAEGKRPGPPAPQKEDTR